MILAVIVSCADTPPLLRVCVPERFPSLSKVNRPTAATGTVTVPVAVGRKIVPTHVEPHLPATGGVEHPPASLGRLAGAGARSKVANKKIARAVWNIVRFMRV